MRLGCSAVLYQIFILGGLMSALYLINPLLVTIFLIGGCAVTYLRPIPDEYSFIRQIRWYQFPIFRIKRALMWFISAVIAFTIAFFVLALFDLV